MKRMTFGLLAGLGAGYLMWTARGRELVDRAKRGSQEPFVDVTVVGTVPTTGDVPTTPAEPTGIEHLRATV
jgi:hypothetical protein